MGSRRFGPKGLPSLFLGDGASSWSGDLASAKLEPEAGDDDLTGPGTPTWTLTGTLVQSVDPSSLWAFVWAHAGEQVAYVYRAGDDEGDPELTGDLIIDTPPSFGGEAEDDDFVHEFAWPVIGQPSLDWKDD